LEPVLLLSLLHRVHLAGTLGLPCDWVSAGEASGGVAVAVEVDRLVGAIGRLFGSLLPSQRGEKHEEN
jgi:hypothetical protein